MLDYRFKPIVQWPGEMTRGRKRSTFRASWSDTITLLEREINHIRKGRDAVVLQGAFRERDIRLDGMVRADARAPEHPGIILSFESIHGPLSYPCDCFDRWKDNVRAIALALDSLRRVDRYGVTKRGEQYTGWKQLPPTSGSIVTPAMTVEQAADFIAETVGWTDHSLLDCELPENHGDVVEGYRKAAMKLHPDRGGTSEAFVQLQEAKRILDAHHGRTA